MSMNTKKEIIPFRHHFTSWFNQVWQHTPFLEGTLIFGIIGVLIWKRSTIIEQLNTANSHHYWVPIASTLVGHTTLSFFNHARELREVNRYIFAEKNKSLNKEIETAVTAGEKSLEMENFYQASRFFHDAAIQCKKLCTDQGSDENNRMLEAIYYKKALALYYAGKLDKALLVLNTELGLEKNQALFTTDNLNLRGLIKFRFGRNNEAKSDFSRSLELNNNQNIIYLFKKFLEEKYNIVTKHSSYKNLESDAPLSIDEPLVTFELLQILGEAYLKQDKYEMAFVCFDAVLKSLPLKAVYYFDKSLILILQAKTCFYLNKKCVNDNFISLNLIDGDENKPFTFSPANMMSECLDNAQELLDEATELMTNDSRNGYVKKMLDKVLELTGSSEGKDHVLNRN